jgi:hypothetical protein
MSEHYSTPEQALIERLRRAPQPELSSEARAMIRARILEALDHPPMPAPRPTPSRPMMAVAVTVVAVTLMAGAALFALSQQNQTVITPTAPATFTVVPPTASPTLTLAPTATESLTLTITPTIVPTSGVGVITVIEGPVDHVDGNVITIYDVPVEVDPNDPVLGDIDEGDVVKVEGDTKPGTVVVVATTVIVVNVTPVGTVDPSNPTTGEVWHDDGTCAHPPPDWAPANGWRQRCQGQENQNNNSNQNNGNNENNGNNQNNGSQGQGSDKHDG